MGYGILPVRKQETCAAIAKLDSPPSSSFPVEIRGFPSAGARVSRV